MRNTKYLLNFYSMYDHTGIRKHLEKMAAKGWMLEKTGTFVWKYRRMEPEKLHFAINYFPKASEFSPGPTEEQQTMFEYCEQAGWKLVSTVAQMQIFCNEQENPVPLETDPAVQVEIISKAMKSSFLPAQILLFAVGVLQLLLFIGRLFSNPIYILSDGINLFSGLCWIGVILLTVVDIGNYFVWRRRARIEAQQNDRFLETKSYPWLQIVILVIVIGGLVLGGVFSKSAVVTGTVIFTIVYTVVLLGGVNLMKRFLRSRNLSKGLTKTLTFLTSFVLAFVLIFFGVRMTVNKSKEIEALGKGVETYEYHGMTWEIYHDELPLVIEDFMDVDYEEYSYQLEESKTFLAEEYEATQESKMDAINIPDLRYRIVKAKVPIFYNMCLEEMLKDVEYWRYSNSYVEEKYRDHYKEIGTEVWQAEAAYREYTGDQPWNNYLICWKDKIVEINFPEEPTKAQMAIVTEKLKDF